MFKKKPFFIVFEGIEGSGKSYQAKRLYNFFRKNKIQSILTREPGGTPGAEIIRKVILKDYFEKNKKIKFDKFTDTLLYMAARNEHVTNKIQPSLKKKKIVICDRFVDSTIAYQVLGKKVPFQFIRNIHNQILRKLKPDLTLILKVTKKSFQDRLRKRRTRNRYDNFPSKFYLKAQNSFLKLAKNKNNYIVLEASKNDKNLEKKIQKIIKKKLNI